MFQITVACRKYFDLALIRANNYMSTSTYEDRKVSASVLQHLLAC